MKLILHHFWKDVRLLRGLLVLWLLMLVTETGATFLCVQPNYRVAGIAESINSSMLLYLAVCAVWTVIIARLIQSEPVTGPFSFWLTRPIPPRISIASKLIFIVTLVILPAVAPKLMDLSLFGMQFHEALEAVEGLLILQFIVALLVIWLATYTRNLTQFWGIIGILFLLFTVSAATLAFSHLTFVGWQGNPQLTASRFIVASGFFLGGLIVSLLVQHIFRATRKALLISFTGLSLCVASSWGWPFVLPHWGHKSTVPQSVPLAYQFDAKIPVTWSETKLLQETFEVARFLVLPPSTTKQGVPASRSVEWSFQPVDGKKVDLQASFETYATHDVSLGYDWLPLLEPQFPGLKFAPTVPEMFRQPVGFMVTPEKLQELGNQTGTLAAKVRGNFLTLEQPALLPMQAPGFARLPRVLVRITAVQEERQGMTIKIEDTGYSSQPAQNSLPLLLLLVDRTNGIGIIGRPSSTGTQGAAGRLGIWTRISEERLVDFNFNAFAPDVQARLAASPAENWVLYVYSVTTSGPFESDLQLTNFVFKPDQAGTHRAH